MSRSFLRFPTRVPRGNPGSPMTRPGPLTSSVFAVSIGHRLRSLANTWALPACLRHRDRPVTCGQGAATFRTPNCGRAAIKNRIFSPKTKGGRPGVIPEPFCKSIEFNRLRENSMSGGGRGAATDTVVSLSSRGFGTVAQSGTVIAHCHGARQSGARFVCKHIVSEFACLNIGQFQPVLGGFGWQLSLLVHFSTDFLPVLPPCSGFRGSIGIFWLIRLRGKVSNDRRPNGGGRCDLILDPGFGLLDQTDGRSRDKGVSL